MTRTTKYHDLLDAAERIVRRDGSAKLTLDAVAAEAGVSKGGLLYHFATKEALVSAMLGRMLAAFDSAQERAMASDPVRAGRWTRAWVRTSVSPAGPSEHDTTAAGLLAAVATNPELVAPMRDRYAEWRLRAADDGIPPETAAIVALAADGLWMADLLGLSAPVGEQRERIIERLLEMTADSAKR
jgi:AcrR family transcriptional regulator